jgi:hypothetical protein
MAEYSEKVLNEAGVQAKIHEFPGLVSFPKPADFRVLSPAELSIEANTFGHSLPTSPEGISGELVYVGSGGFPDYEGKDVAGKITLSELSYAPPRHEKQRIAALKGAVGAVMMNWGRPDNQAVPFGSVKPAWGNPTPEAYAAEMPTIPCIGIARTAGLQLKEMCNQGSVRVWLCANVENCWRPIQITVGEIPCSNGQDFVVVGGHQDSWFGEGATDNAAGSACTMELARFLSQNREKLCRSIVFGFWTAHETGTMIGSSWFVDTNWDRLRNHMVAYLQIDQPACIGTTRWGTTSNIELRRFHQSIERRLLPGRDLVWHRQRKTGDASFFGLGVPMIHGEGIFTEEELEATALANVGWWHHSIESTLDKVDFNWLAEHLRIYAAYLWELCTTPILPFEFVSTADLLIERLVELSEFGASIGLPKTLTQAKEFRDAAVGFDQLALKWRQKYHTGNVCDDGPAETLNACMKRLTRLVIPISSTIKGTYGHDSYGLTPQGTVLPCLFEVPRLADLPLEHEERTMLETKLIRERNRVTDTLVDARAIIQDTLRRVS